MKLVEPLVFAIPPRYRASGAHRLCSKRGLRMKNSERLKGLGASIVPAQKRVELGRQMG